MRPGAQVYVKVFDDEEAKSSGLVHRRIGHLVRGVMGCVVALLAAGCLVAARGAGRPGSAAGAATEAVSLAGAGGPAMVHFSQIVNKTELPKLAGAGGSKSYLKDVAFSKVPGKEMAAGLYRLNAGPALIYTYTYEEIKYIVEGEFHLTDGTGQKVVARAGDLMHFPRGTKVTFETPNTGLGYYIGQRVSPEDAVEVDSAVKEAMESNPAMVYFPQIKETIGTQPYLENEDKSNSFLGDIVFSKVLGKEMTAGLYLDEAGPALHYTYTYEELKYILEGEFHLTDGTGQKVVAKKGDLMYFPKGSQIKFETPELGLGLYCGQRRGGEA